MARHFRPSPASGHLLDQDPSLELEGHFRAAGAASNSDRDTHQSISQDNLTNPGTEHSTGYGRGAPATEDNPGSIDGEARKYWNCGHQDCGRSFHQWNDLKRHLNTHIPGAASKAFECPEFGCSRKGTWGFMRRDKLVDHLRSKHKKAVGRNEFRVSPYDQLRQLQLKIHGFKRDGKCYVNVEGTTEG